MGATAGPKFSPPFVVSAAALIVFGAASVMVEARNELSWMDPVTASMKFESRWFGLTTRRVVVPSPIEEWVLRHGGEVEPRRWQFLHDRGRNAWGKGRSWGCGTAPPIYDLKGELGREFIKASSDQQIRDLLALMRDGDEIEQKKVVRETIDRIIEGSDVRAQKRRSR